MHVTEGKIAINCGDLALSLVTRAVLDDGKVDDALKVRLLHELVAMTARTIEGQALDLGWVRDDRSTSPSTTTSPYAALQDRLLQRRDAPRMRRDHRRRHRGAGRRAAGAWTRITSRSKTTCSTSSATRPPRTRTSAPTSPRASAPSSRSAPWRTNASATSSRRNPLAPAPAIRPYSTAPSRSSRSRGVIDFARDYSLELVARAKDRIAGLGIDKHCEGLFLAAQFLVERLISAAAPRSAPRPSAPSGKMREGALA